MISRFVYYLRLIAYVFFVCATILMTIRESKREPLTDPEQELL